MKHLLLKMGIAVLSVAISGMVWLLLTVPLNKTSISFLQTILFYVSPVTYIGWFLFGYLCIFFYTAILKFFQKVQQRNHQGQVLT